MIVRFDKATFEAALPLAEGINQPLWRCLGMNKGEYCYLMQVKPGVCIYIRSTVQMDGLAADVAKDSIRCWLAKDESGESLGSKEARWIARTKGWDQRLIETLRMLWRIGRKLGKCAKCGAQMLAIKVKKPGPNQGRWFSKCPKCVNGFGDWLTDASPIVITSSGMVMIPVGPSAGAVESAMHDFDPRDDYRK